jgi:hypothetical protein
VQCSGGVGRRSRRRIAQSGRSSTSTPAASALEEDAADVRARALCVVYHEHAAVGQFHEARVAAHHAINDLRPLPRPPEIVAPDDHRAALLAPAVAREQHALEVSSIRGLPGHPQRLRAASTSRHRRCSPTSASPAGSACSIRPSVSGSIVGSWKGTLSCGVSTASSGQLSPPSVERSTPHGRTSAAFGHVPAVDRQQQRPVLKLRHGLRDAPARDSTAVRRAATLPT